MSEIKTTATTMASATNVATETTNKRDELLNKARKADLERRLKNEEKAQREREKGATDLDKRMKSDLDLFLVVASSLWNYGLGDIIEPIIGYRKDPTAEELKTAMPESMIVDGALCTNHRGSNGIYAKALKVFDKKGNLLGVQLNNEDGTTRFVDKETYNATKSVLKFDECKLTFKNLCIAYYQGYKCGGICTSLRAYMATERYMDEHAADFARLANVPLSAALAKEQHNADIYADRLIDVYNESKSAERLELPKPKAEKKEEPKAEVATLTESEELSATA